MHDESLIYGSIIPPEVFLNHDIAPMEKILFGVIYAHIHKNNFECCDLSNKQLGDSISAHPNSVSKAISKLQKYQYIKVEFGHKEESGGFKRKIYINEDFHEIYAHIVLKKAQETEFYHE